ncbi:hypothetical protein LPJ75_005111, partial [Coemansia sp. RSA 2598]
PSISLVDTAASRQGGCTALQYILCWDSSAHRHVLYRSAAVDHRQCLDNLDSAPKLTRPLDLLPGSERASRAIGSCSGSSGENENEYRADMDVNIDIAMAVDKDMDMDMNMDEDFDGNFSSAIGAEGSRAFSICRKGPQRQASLSVQRRSSAAASAAAIAAASRRKSGYSTAMKNDRRSSILGRVSFNDSPGPSFAVDIFREQRQMKAEVVLTMCWKERRQRSDSRRQPAPKAQLCVIQSFSGADIVCVLSTEAGMVIGLESAGFGEIFRYAARAIAPVCSVRDQLDDLLILAPTGGSLAIVPGAACGGEPITLPLYANASKRDIVSIEYSERHLVSVAQATPSGQQSVVLSARIRLTRLAAAVMYSLSAVLSKSASAMLRRSILASAAGAKNADDEFRRVSELLIHHGSDKGQPSATLQQRVRSELASRADAVLFALRLVYEDAALRKDESRPRLIAMGALLLRLAQKSGSQSQYQACLCEGFGLGLNAADALAAPLPRRREEESRTAILPSFSKWAVSLCESKRGAKLPAPFPTLGSVARLFGIDDAEPFDASRNPLD